MSKRDDWDTYFMKIAFQVSTRATCDRLHVGCVLVDSERSILATGYNGSVVGGVHCDDHGHDMVNGHCVRTVHAEVNAVAQAARRGVRLQGATAYVTAFPCWGCAKTLRNAGIEVVNYAKAYRVDERVLPCFKGHVYEVAAENPEAAIAERDATIQALVDKLAAASPDA